MTQAETRRIARYARSQVESAAQTLLQPSAKTIEESARRMATAAAILEAVSTSVRNGRTADMELKTEVSAIQRTTALIAMLLRQAVELRIEGMPVERYTPGGDTQVDWPARQLIAEG